MCEPFLFILISGVQVSTKSILGQKGKKHREKNEASTSPKSINKLRPKNNSVWNGVSWSLLWVWYLMSVIRCTCFAWTYEHYCMIICTTV